MTTHDTPARGAERTSLAELALLFLKLGTIGFGGPAAHIALMEDEVVRRRRWLSREAFLDYVGATNLIPGPNSTELAIQIGRDRAGWAGLVVAGAAFILPAGVIVGVLAWAYVRFGRLPEASALLYGVKPVVIAVVVQALWRLGRSAVKNGWLAALAAAAVAATVGGMHELLVLACAGIVSVLAVGARMRGDRPGGDRLRKHFPPGDLPSGSDGSGDRAAEARSPGTPPPGDRRTMRAITGLAAPGASAIQTAGASLGAGAAAAGALWTLFGTFLKIGAVLFGSGYVLLAFLRADFVERLGWLTERQLLDAVAVGQVTPGPVFTTATFIGYVVAGVPGAVLGTVAIFLPAFVFVAMSGPLVPKLRRSRLAGAALDGVNVASLALMAVVTWQLGRAALVDVPTMLLAGAAFVLLVHARVNSAWIILGGATAGYLVYALG